MWTRYLISLFMVEVMPKRTVQALTTAFGELSAINRLKAEVELLTRYSTDVIYRLRYDSMQYDYISPAVVHLLGYTREELGAISLRSLIIETRIVSDGLKAIASYAPLEETRKRGEVGKWQADYRMKTKSGQEIWVSDISYPWFDKKGAIIGSIGSLRDITERMQAEEALRAEALRAGVADPLTNLASRQTFWNRFEQEVQRVKRTQGDVSLLLVDIDHSDRIRELYGESVYEAAIVSVATIIRSGIRGIDVPARLSAAEFGVVLPETSPEGATRCAMRIRDAVARHTFFVGAEPMGCTVSIGISSNRLSSEPDATRLYKLADMRRYIARHTGGNRFSSDEMAENIH